MSMPQKYMFDNSFDSNEVRIDPLEELRISFERKLEDARKKSFEEGREAGRRDAEATIEQQTANALEKLAAMQDELFQSYRRQQSLAETKAIEFGITAGCKLARELIRKAPEALVEGFFREALELVPGEAEITARLSPAVAEATIASIETWKAETGYKGHILILTDETLKPSDVAITWSDGGIKRSVDELMQAINTAMTGYFSKCGEGNLIPANSAPLPATEADKGAANQTITNQSEC